MANKGSPAKQRYDKAYNARPAEKKKRAQRNKASRQANCPPGHDADHKTPMRKGGSNSKSNVRCVKTTANRGWRKGKKGYDR